MIVHQAIEEHSHIVQLATFCQPPHKPLSVSIFKKDSLASIAPDCDVVDSTWVLQSELSRHMEKLVVPAVDSKR